MLGWGYENAQITWNFCQDSQSNQFLLWMYFRKWKLHYAPGLQKCMYQTQLKLAESQSSFKDTQLTTFSYIMKLENKPINLNKRIWNYFTQYNRKANYLVN